MALSVLRSVESEHAVENGRQWLLEARQAFSSTEEFAKKIGTEPQGINPLIENTILFLDGAFFANTPPGQPAIKGDLAWLSGRPLWSNTARAVSCLCQYRNWLR
jgi:hypothetical protein